MLRRCRPLLGTFVEITAASEDAIGEAFAAIAEVHRLMSAHEAKSDLSRANRFAYLRPVKVHEWTAHVLERALHWAEESKGLFDPVRAGNCALRHGFIPRHSDQPRPDLAADWRSIELRGRWVRLARPSCIDLGGIAKGFAVDLAIEALRSAGCSQGLVNAGGDLRGFGPASWPVTLVDPLSRRPVAQVEVENEALATSAGLPAGGRLSFDHLGGPGSQWASVTVLAPTALEADALTKLAWSETGALQRVLAGARTKAVGITATGRVELIGCAEDLAA